MPKSVNPHIPTIDATAAALPVVNEVVARLDALPEDARLVAYYLVARAGGMTTFESEPEAPSPPQPHTRKPATKRSRKYPEQVLAHIRKNGPSTTAEIAGGVFGSDSKAAKSRVSNIINRLSKAGKVKRRPGKGRVGKWAVERKSSK